MSIKKQVEKKCNKMEEFKRFNGFLNDKRLAERLEKSEDLAYLALLNFIEVKNNKAIKNKEQFEQEIKKAREENSEAVYKYFSPTL